jgi:hypothetical protein
MKKLTKEQADAILPLGRGNSTRISGMLKQLEIGEGLVIEKSDWKAKTPPLRIVNYLSKKTGRKFRKGTMPDRSGWFVQRLS